MGLGSFYVTSPRMCFSAEDYNEWMNNHYHNIEDGDDEKIIPNGFIDLNVMNEKNIESL